MRHKNVSPDLNIADFLQEIWRAKAFLILGLFSGFLLAFALISAAVPRYQASMMIGPAQHMELPVYDTAGEGERASPRSASQGDTAQQNFVNFQAMYKGAGLARLLVRDPRIVEGLKADQGFSFLSAPQDWNAAHLSAYIGKRVWLDPFGETALRQLNYRHSDPDFAAYFLQQIHRVTDQLIRADMRTSVDQRIAYLERESAKVLNPEHRRVMTSLLLEQERVRMIVLMDEPVAAKVIEKPSVSAQPVWPDVYIFYGGFGLLGLIMGYVAFGFTQMVAQERVPAHSKSSVGQRPLNYASWFKAEGDNSNIDYEARRRDILKQASDAAE